MGATMLKACKIKTFLLCERNWLRKTGGKRHDVTLFLRGTCMLNPFSCVRLFATLWTVACQAPLSMGFSRQEYWSGLPCPSPPWSDNESLIRVEDTVKPS